MTSKTPLPADTGSHVPTSFRDLYKQYAGALAYVHVKNKHDDDGIGSAFHVGEGIFVTARHVLEDQSIIEVATTSLAEIVVSAPSEEGWGPDIHIVEPRSLEITHGPYFSSDPSVDVAVFQVSNFDPKMPWVPLGSHLDDMIGDDDFVLTGTVVLGYPPIPNTNVPRLVAVRGEVNAVINVRHTKNVHFVVSSMARGGFSGGLVLSEAGYALGVVTESLVHDNAPPETGFMSVLSVDAIYRCLSEHFDLEASNFITYLNESTLVSLRFAKPDLARLNPRIASANILVYDDDRDVFIELTCTDHETLMLAFSAFSRITPVAIDHSRPGYLFLLPKNNPPAVILVKAAQAAREEFLKQGYHCVDNE